MGNSEGARVMPMLFKTYNSLKIKDIRKSSLGLCVWKKDTLKGADS
jgi:hypothetical protein